MLERVWFYQSGLQIGAEYDGSGVLQTRFVYGSQSHSPDYMIKGGTSYKFIKDHLGSIRMVVNVSSGVIAQRLDYDEFGVVLQDTNPGFQPFGFAGGLYDSDTKLVRFGARDYDPTIGRWTTKDPIGFNGGTTNLYEYAHGDPINFVDTNGKNPGLIVAAPLIIGAVSAVANAVTAAVTGQSGQQIKDAAVGGFLGGAAATITALGAIAGAAPTATAVGLGVAVDLGFNIVFQTGGLPDGASVTDFANGVNALTQPKKVSCP